MPTHSVIWIDHKEARIFHVHPEATDETTVLAPQHHLQRHPKGRGEARERRIDSSARSREHSTASMPSSSSGVVSEARILQVRARAQASAGIKGRRHRESRFAARGIGGARAAARSRFGRSRSGWWCRRQWSERSGASRLIATAAIRTAIDAPLVSCCAASTSRLIRPNAFDNHLRSLAGLHGRRPSGRLGAEGRRMLGGKAKA
ncbi:MAG: hypothetical protein QOI93_5711 [Rhodospirillaceae bacterium]|jgi:hypothetical protein|nr:hypothetical protein [Rhodospirillaceae bacterium]